MQTMGVNSAADKVKWAAIHFIEHIPHMRSALVSTDNAANQFIETLSNARFTLANIDQALHSPEGVVQTTSAHVIETLLEFRSTLMQGVNLAARGIHAATTGFIFALFIITLTVVISLYIHNGHSLRNETSKS
jgi:hypothetical protein